MKIICEMTLSKFFKLSTGQTALVGKLIPDVGYPIPKTKADLYVGNKKIKTITIVGEDRFLNANKEKQKDRRAIRTNSDIAEDLNDLINQPIKLVIYG